MRLPLGGPFQLAGHYRLREAAQLDRECPYLGATEALARATPLATGSLPIPIVG